MLLLLMSYVCIIEELREGKRGGPERKLLPIKMEDNRGKSKRN